MTFKQNYFNSWIWYFDAIHLYMKKMTKMKISYIISEINIQLKNCQPYFPGVWGNLRWVSHRVFSESFITHSLLQMQHFIYWILGWFVLHHVPLSRPTPSSLWNMHRMTEWIVSQLPRLTVLEQALICSWYLVSRNCTYLNHSLIWF